MALAVSVVVPVMYISVVEVVLYLSTRRDPLTLLWSNWYHQTKIFSLGATTTVVSL